MKIWDTYIEFFNEGAENVEHEIERTEKGLIKDGKR